MKKFVKGFMLLLTVVAMAMSFTACGNGGDDHTHAFDQEKVASNYLASKATCESPAKYYKSCTCGEKGTETFENGTADANAHDYDENECTICGETGNFTVGLAMEVNAEDTGWIVKGVGDSLEENIVIPEKIDGLPVVAIADRAFYSNKAIKSVKLSKNIKSIGYGAFQDSTVEEVILNDGLTDINGQAFSSVPNLTKIVIPASVTFMDSTVFNGWTATSQICCKATAQPSSWVAGWQGSSCNAEIVWGYTGN